jgi:hypothetical protein
MIPDLRNSIEASLDKRLGADKNSIPDLEGFQVPKMNTATYPHSIPKLPRYRSPDRPPH